MGVETTLVFQGDFAKNKNPITEPHCGLASVAWSQGNSIADKNTLLDFVLSINSGELSTDEIHKAANKLADEMGF